MLGKQIVEHARVLHAYESSEHTQHAGRKSEIKRNAVGVSGSCTRTRANDHFVRAEVLDNLFNQWKERHSAPIDNALAANFDHVGFREYLDRRRLAGLRHQTFVVERRTQQRFAEFGEKVILHLVIVRYR